MNRELYISRDVVRSMIQQLKKEQDLIDSEINLKFENVNLFLMNLTSSLSDTFRHNFPTCQFSYIPLPSFYENQYTDSKEAKKILSGESKVIMAFISHIKFVERLDDRYSFDGLLNYYFKYWSDDYHEENSKLNQDILSSLDHLNSVITFKAKDIINITNSNNDVWIGNAPVTYTYLSNTNMFNLELDNGLTCKADSNTIRHCPVIHKNVEKTINEEYKKHFEFDYFDFNNVRDTFITNLVNLLTYILFTRFNDLKVLLTGENEFFIKLSNNTDNNYTIILDGTPYVLNLYIKFKDIFKEEGEKDFWHNSKNIEIKVSDVLQDKGRIVIKFTNTNQILVFNFYRNEQTKTIEFEGNTADELNDSTTQLFLYKEALKVFILYFGNKFNKGVKEYLDIIDGGLNDSLEALRIK